MLVVFVFTAYARPGVAEVGSPQIMFDSLWTSALLCRSTGGVGYDYADGLLDNAGVCVPRGTDGGVDPDVSIDAATTSCSFVLCEEAGDPACADPLTKMVDQSGHEWHEVGCAATEVCVSSFATMSSTGGAIFGIVNIVVSTQPTRWLLVIPGLF